MDPDGDEERVKAFLASNVDQPPEWWDQQAKELLAQEDAYPVGRAWEVLPDTLEPNLASPYCKPVIEFRNVVMRSQPAARLVTTDALPPP